MIKKYSKLYIGTSGWSYEWENFYPKRLSSIDKLKYFSQQFNTVEVNYSFYHLPRQENIKNWFKITPDNFIFAIKLSRYITHIKRLKNINQELETFLKRISLLQQKLGPVLIQLPPSFKINNDIIKSFLEQIRKFESSLKFPEPLKIAFEFRHPSWFEKTPEREAVLETLKKFNSCFVFAHSGVYPYPSDEPKTADFLYFRFHGPKEIFASKYGAEKLKPFSKKIKQALDNQSYVYAFFNNDINGYAVEDAKILAFLLNN